MTSSLPVARDGAELGRALARPELFGDGLEVIRARHALGAGEVRPAGKGSFGVFFLGDDRVVKLVPDRWRSQYEGDRAMLPLALGRLPVATPEVLAAGDLDGWGYLVTTRLPGVSAGEAWARASAPARVDLARRIGELLAAIAALPIDRAPALDLDWPAFVRAQAASAAARHGRGGAPEAWTREVDATLAPVLDAIVGAPRALVHADVSDDNLLVEERAGRLIPTGLVDFGDAFVAEPLYDLVSPVTFFARGDRAIVGALLDGLGVPERARDEAFARRAKAWSLLHRFADLARDTAKAPGARGAPTLAAALDALWPVEPPRDEA